MGRTTTMSIDVNVTTQLRDPNLSAVRSPTALPALSLSTHTTRNRQLAGQLLADSGDQGIEKGEVSLAVLEQQKQARRIERIRVLEIGRTSTGDGATTRPITFLFGPVPNPEELRKEPQRQGIAPGKPFRPFGMLFVGFSPLVTLAVITFAGVVAFRLTR